MMNRQNLAILFLLTFLSAILAERLFSFTPNLSPLVYILLATLIFLLVFMLFDRLLWRYLPIGNRPNIHGDWLGRLSSSYYENTNVEPLRVRIIQRWLTIRIDFIATYSTSSSSSSLFFRDSNGQYVLAYIYRAQPNEDADGKVTPHIGLTVLRLVEEGRLSGYYHHLDTKDDGYDFVHGQVVLTRPELFNKANL